MASHPRRTDSISNRATQRNLQRRGIRAPEVWQQAVTALRDTLTLQMAAPARYSRESMLAVLLHAAAHASSIEDAALSLPAAPHPNTVRLTLQGATVETVEREINHALLNRQLRRLLKRRLEVACDLKHVPYWGEPDPLEKDFVWKARALRGTTRFFVYATLYVIKHGQRFTIAVRACRKKEGLPGALQGLLQRFAALGGQMGCLYLDRGFYSVAVLRYRMEEADVPFCLAAPLKGQKNGLGALVRRGAGQYAYTVRSQKHGSLGVQVAVAGRYWKGRWKKHGRGGYAFVVHRFPFALSGVFEKYRRRFGIESSYRVNEKARARTTAKGAALRLLLFGLAALLQNLWVLLKWACVSLPRRGGRVIKHRWFTFLRMLSFLRHAIERVYQVVEEVRVS
jgi:putative transposase